MRERPPGIADPELAAVLAGQWQLVITRLRYLPAGFGGYHWQATDGSGRTWFVTVSERGGSYGPALAAAMETAAELAERGLDFIVAPVRTAAGRATARLRPRHVVTVFPYRAGQPGRWGDELSTADREAVARMLAALHCAVPPRAAPLRPLGLARRDAIDAALAERGSRWQGGPLAEPARGLLAARAGALSQALASFDLLVSQVRQDARPLVITHGEPHPGNLLRAGGRLLLIDWETAGLAPPERDLWWVAGEQAAYTALTGHSVSPEALDLYRVRWLLDDISLFLALFRSPHQRDADSETALAGLRDSLLAVEREYFRFSR